MKKEIEFLRAQDVASYLNVSIAQAYRIIRKMNEELEKEGYLIISGRVNKEYFESKVILRRTEVKKAK